MTHPPEIDRRHTGNRRQGRRILGIDFTVPVPWLVTLIVLGLVQFGVFTQEFKDFREQVKEVKSLLQAAIDNSAISMQRNLLQDGRLDEHERRINKLEEKVDAAK